MPFVLALLSRLGVGVATVAGSMTWLLRPAGILAAFYAFLVFGMNFLPASEPLPNEFTSGITYFFGLLRGMDFILPMDTVFTIFSLGLVYIAVKWTVRLVLWIIQVLASVTSI